MELDEISDLYLLISKGTEEISSRKGTMELRKICISSVSAGQGFNKIAFDTRRIDQEVEMNPRRGLQNYNRSEAFLTEAMGSKIKNLAKLKDVLGELKQQYGKEPEWQDSNARVLLSTLDKGLRTNINDGDFTESQPGTGSLGYIEELLHVRYRLSFDDLHVKTASDLKRVILSKDEELIRKDVNKSLEITKSDIGTQSYDSLLDKLFTGVKATSENKSVERTITITIKDKILED